MLAALWAAAIPGAAYSQSLSPSIGAATIYAMSSRVCHQKTERSFHTAGQRWPVCARCSGLYLSAPLGAIVALSRRRRQVAGNLDARLRTLLVGAALPTGVSVIAEWLGIVSVTNLARALAAVPLGAAAAYAVLRVCREGLPIK